MNRWIGGANQKVAEIRGPGTDLPANSSHRDRSLAVTQIAGQNGTLLATGRSDQSHKKEEFWNRVCANLDLAEQNCQFGVIVPEFRRLRGVTRTVARCMTRGLLYILRVFTGPQRTFNAAVFHVLGDLHHSMRQSDQAQQGLRDQERRALVDLRVRYHKLEMDFMNLRARLLSSNPASLSLVEDGERQPIDSAQSPEPNPVTPDLEALYVAFEERFRGSREEIRERLKVYLPLLRNAALGEEPMPILDLGCGRGEWLELLRDEGLHARGVDASIAMVEASRQQGLEVCLGDAPGYLRGVPDASLGGVTGFHIIEHLPLKALIQMLDEIVRVLKPGGIALFETPNPENVLVGSNNFYLDPTHHKPLPSLLVQFLAEYCGLSRVEVRKLNPPPHEMRVHGSELAERFNHYFYGPRDYAVIGWKD
jgi:O-antigen chain-terminating methyltransferase